jgi:hypothetical protein
LIQVEGGLRRLGAAVDHAGEIAVDAISKRSCGSSGEVLLQPVDVVVAVGDVGLRTSVAEQRQRRLDAVDDEFVERAAQAHHAFDAVAAMHDQLADQAVVVGRDR